jgi:hypothetical protein
MMISKESFAAFRELQGNDNYRVIPTLCLWDLFSNDFHSWRKLVYDYLDAGADTFAAWDGNSSMDWFAKIEDIGRCREDLWIHFKARCIRPEQKSISPDAC